MTSFSAEGILDWKKSFFDVLGSSVRFISLTVTNGTNAYCSPLFITLAEDTSPVDRTEAQITAVLERT